MEEDYAEIQRDISTFFNSLPPNDTNAAEEEDYFAKQVGKVRVIGMYQDIQERKKYADSIFTLVVMWLFFILMI